MPPTGPEKTLQEMIEQPVAALGYECVEAVFVVEAGRRILRVRIDSPGGVPLEACAAVSRALGPMSDASAELQWRYVRAVSAPGVDRRQSKPEHVRRFAGERVKIRLREKMDGGVTVSGVLIGLQDDVLTVQTPLGDKQVPLANVARAHLHRDLDALLRPSR